jgi:Tfp pilus assembly protein PilO
MKHLSKQKKQHLLLVSLATVGILAGMWFGLISWQQGRIAKLASERDTTKTKLKGMNDTLDRAQQIEQKLEEETQRLATAEQLMASGDLYAWIINTVRDFKSKHPAVDIPQFSTIQIGETTLLPKFPYQQATLTVAGKAYYHDLGVFISDFENEFPYIRLQNLVLEPGSATDGGYSEKLAFRVDIVALVKPEA